MLNNTNVTIGKGKLAGKGVYAARDLKKGEMVVPFNLKELSQEEFDVLPDGEWEWTHSFSGKIYHFPEPERYVNHSDTPVHCQRPKEMLLCATSKKAKRLPLMTSSNCNESFRYF